MRQNAPMTNNAGYERFTIKQKITVMVNRYEIRSVDANGGEGPLIAMAQQKRMAFKEQVTFYADEARTQPVFGFKARKRLDLAATYDVTDASGTPIGSLSGKNRIVCSAPSPNRRCGYHRGMRSCSSASRK